MPLSEMGPLPKCTPTDICIPPGYLDSPTFQKELPREEGPGGINAPNDQEVTRKFGNEGRANGTAEGWIESKFSRQKRARRNTTFARGVPRFMEDDDEGTDDSSEPDVGCGPSFGS